MRTSARLRATARAMGALLLFSLVCTIGSAACSEGGTDAAARAVAPSQPATAEARSSAASAADARPADTAATAAPLEATAAPHASADSLFSRPVVIGASASDGFGLSVREHGAKPGDGVSVSLADIFRVGRHSRPTVEGYASSMAFVNPGPILSGEMDRALRRSPSIVIGIDYLFWYVYGTKDASGAPMRTAEERLANLDRGLAQLDRALSRGIPVIVGDILDMKAAIGKMLSRAQVPDPATLDAVNARIRGWAQSRPGARVFGLHESVSSITTNGSLRAGGTEWSVDDHGPLLLRDELHPSFPGLVAVASSVVESAATLLPPESRTAFEASFDLDPMLVRRRLLDENVRGSGETRSRTVDEP